MEFKCPYCANHQFVDPEDLDWTAGDEKIITCRNCDKKYSVHGYETVDYEVSEIEGDM